MVFNSGPLGIIGSLGAVSIVVLLVLFLFSVVSWAIILYKWRILRSVNQEEQRFFRAYDRGQDREEVRRQARKLTESPSAAVFLGVMERITPEGDKFGRDSYPPSSGVDPLVEQPAPDRLYLDRVVAHIMQNHISKQEAYLAFLATTANVTPFIGLLGTVLGIINAFAEIGRQGTASIAAVAPGVAEALVATAAGLFTAIPAVIAYNYFLTRIRRTTHRVEAFSIEFLNAMQIRPKPMDVRG